MKLISHAIKISILFFNLFFISINYLFAQKISIKSIENKPIANASVIVQVYYKANDYLIRETKEKLFSFVTDTTGTFKLNGEFQNENFKVDSISIKIQHENYYERKFTTLDYSNDKNYVYTIYLVNKKNDVRIISFPKEEKNQLDIYNTNEIAKLLKIDEHDVIKLIESKKINAKKIGQKYFVSGNDIRKYLED